jgi:pyruvate dehydrogenase E2 component (dihydrolipoamide acetyltransferase)
LASKAASGPPAKKESAPERSKEQEPPPAPPSSPPTPREEPKRELATGDRIFASPIAKKIALERGIPLAQVKGTGPEGRVIREDVEKYVASSATTSGATPATTSSTAQPPEYIDIPVTNMRRVIGARLTQSKQELPHYYVTVDIHMDKVIKLREVFNKTLADKGAKLSVNDFIIKATACALADVPEANSAWLGETIRQ